MADTIFGNPEDGKPAAPKQETPAAEPSTQQDDAKPAEPTQAPDPYATMLDTIRTEDGRQKYATVSDAISSIPHAQDHIKSLTEKVREMEEQLKQAKKVDDIMERVESTQAAKEQPSSKQELDETKIAQLLEAQLTEREKRVQMEQNINSVSSTLKEQFGDKAEEKYKAKAAELGLDLETFNGLSATSPKAVLHYFGVAKQDSNSGTYKSSVNTAAFAQQQKPAEDPMARYRSSDSELLHKWRASASKVTTEG